MYPKPTPKERGRTKDTREKRSSSPRWKTTEREKARWTQQRYGVEDDPTVRHLVSSTGRIGHLTGLGVDITSAGAVGEVKDRNAVPGWLRDAWKAANSTASSVLEEHDLPQWLETAWTQIIQYADSRITKRRPLLFLSYGKGKRPTFVSGGKTLPLPDMHIITPEHHDELVRGWVAAQQIRSKLWPGAVGYNDSQAAFGLLNEINTILEDAGI